MRLINVRTLQFEEYFDVPSYRWPPYAILSHRWQSDEITYKDWRKKRDIDAPGSRKVIDFCQLVKKLSIDWEVLVFTAGKDMPDSRLQKIKHVWIDTCCIDKKSSSELSEAINSMYEWYRQAAICFVYLIDVNVNSHTSIEASLEHSNWFTRGWTLQELLSPRYLFFCDHEWRIFGKVDANNEYDRPWQHVLENLPSVPVDLSSTVSRITSIPERYLRTSGYEQQRLRPQPCLAEKMSWAARRSTAKLEDRAYCLLGLFGVNLPLIYGEGTRAFARLLEEIVKASADKTIFAWDIEAQTENNRALLPSSLLDYRFSGVVTRLPETPLSPYAITNAGMRMQEHLFELKGDMIPARLKSMWAAPWEDARAMLLRLDCTTQTSLGLLKFVFDHDHASDEIHMKTAFNSHMSITIPEQEYMIYLLLQERSPVRDKWEKHNPVETVHQPGLPMYYIKQGLVGVSRDVDVHKMTIRMVPTEPFYISLDGSFW